MNRPERLSTRIPTVCGSSIIVDARDPVASEAFRKALFGDREPETVRNARSMLRRGKPEDARAYMAGCDRFAKAFDWPVQQWPVDLLEQLSEQLP